MKSKEKSSSSALLLKILGISLIFIFGIVVAVRGDNLDIKSVKVVFENGSSINILTTKGTVSQILAENHILLLEDEITTPNLEDELDDSNKIIISKSNGEVTQSSSTNASYDGTIDLEKLENDYEVIRLKRITIHEEIPFETITKDVSDNADSTENKVLQEGENGIREIIYDTKYKGDIELINERILVSSTVIKEPVNKIVQISSRQVVTISTSATTSRSFVSRNLDIDSSENYLAKAVEGITPTVKTMNTSAYTASTCGKDPSSSGYGITASGERATSWYTVAAGKGYAIGTIIYIPYFEDAPNGGWFVVQDRGGAISNSHLDVYMDSYNDCMDFGRRYLECYIYEF